MVTSGDVILGDPPAIFRKAKRAETKNPKRIEILPSSFCTKGGDSG